MKSPLPSPRPRGPRGFTLLEVLVAAAVLGLVMALVLQIANGVMQATGGQNRQMEATAAARRALDVMAADLQRAVVGENAAILVPAAAGTNLFAALTHRRPPAGQTGRFLAVRYYTATNGDLYRAYAPVAYTEANLLAAAASAGTAPNPLASGLLAVAARALSGTNSHAVSAAPSAHWSAATYNGTPAPAGFKALVTASPGFAAALTNRSRALEIWMVSVDGQTAGLLEKIGRREALGNALAAAADDPGRWRAVIDGADLPAQAKSSIRVLSKTIPLP